MSRPTRALALLTLLAGACAANHSRASSASASPASGAPAEAIAKRAEPQLICRTEYPIGSNIAKRVCYAQDELEAAGVAAQDDIRRAMQRASAQPKRD